MNVLAECLLRWAAWTEIATVKDHDEKHDNQHGNSAMETYAAWFVCSSCAACHGCAAAAGMSSSDR
eukprot:7592907-Heterocapsa_arctica.AAC.1